MTYLNGKELGSLVFDILANDFHLPLIDGKCNREGVEEQITIGILSKALGPMSAEDVAAACELIDELISEEGMV